MRRKPIARFVCIADALPQIRIRHNLEPESTHRWILWAGTVMISRTTLRGLGLLLALAGASMASARAQQAPWAGIATPEPADADSPPKLDLPEKVDLPEPDWSQLNTSGSLSETQTAQKRASAPPNVDPGMSWSRQNKPNGSAALSVKQPLSPFWDARIGADMTVVNQPPTLTNSDLLRQKFSTDGQPPQSTGTAWAALTAPGVGSVWDKTAIEVRLDPAQDQSKLGTSLSKLLPFWGDQYSLTLQNGYNVIQQSLAPVVGITGHPTRNYQTDQSAKLSIADTGTSFIAGQSLSSTDEKWLRKIGAEQKLFGGVSISGSISETPQGTPNRSLTAGFKHSW
jgi:hypothetical protein